MRVGAVVLHYRFWPGIRSTLRCLLAQHPRPDEIVVVDNCSGDGSASRIRDEFAGLTVIESSHNGGYAAGMNVGIRRLLIQEMEAILLLTHDCELGPDAVAKLVERLEVQPRVAAVGPLLGFSSSREQVFSAGGTIDPITWETGQILVPDKIDEWRGMPPHEVDWLDGAAILLRSKAVREAGPLSTAYFMYFEESEYLLRLRRRGWSVECVPAAVGWQEPRMLTFPLEFRIRNRLRFLARNAPMAVLRRELAYLLSSSIKGSIRRPRRARKILIPRIRGITDFALARNGPPGMTA
jgi:N-acetylglucosaminyl-diphospho-decaprenol L-rhamnosyltransferase